VHAENVDFQKVEKANNVNFFYPIPTALFLSFFASFQVPRGTLQRPLQLAGVCGQARQQEAQQVGPKRHL
jgi:hypothetical protein